MRSNETEPPEGDLRPPIVSAAFLRASAACWMASSVTTLGLIVLPRFVAPAGDFEAQARLAHDPIHLARLGIAIAHPLIGLVGALGVLAVCARRAAGAAATGFVFFLLWAGVEAVQQSLSLVARNWTWRASYLATTDPAVRASLRASIVEFEAIWDGLFFLLLIAFIVANLSFAVATRGGRVLQRTVSVFFVLAAALGALSFATSFGGGTVSPVLMSVLYPTIQPAGRLLTGLWLLRLAASSPRRTRPGAE